MVLSPDSISKFAQVQHTPGGRLLSVAVWLPADVTEPFVDDGADEIEFDLIWMPSGILLKNQNVNIQLQQIAPTQDQCIEYQLPRTPIKDSDRAKGKFEARYGSGATELDALEARHPGELERIVSDALEPFYDPDIASEIRGEICEHVYNSIIGQAGSGVNGVFVEIRADAENIQQVVKPHTAALQGKVQKLKGRLLEIDVDVVLRLVKLLWALMTLGCYYCLTDPPNPTTTALYDFAHAILQNTLNILG